MENINFAIEQLTKKPLFLIFTVIQLIIAFVLVFIGISLNNSIVQKSNYIETLYDGRSYYLVDSSLTKDLNYINLESLESFYNYLKENQIEIYLTEKDSLFIANDNISEKFLANFETVKIDNKTFNRVNSISINWDYIKDFGVELAEGKFSSSNSDYIPIILGYNYKDIFELNEKIPYVHKNEENNSVIKYFEVSGFLENNTSICIKGNPEQITNMNDYVILIKDSASLINDSNNDMIKKINLFNYITNSYINIDNVDQLKNLEEKSFELGLNYKFKNTNDVFEKFKNEYDNLLIKLKVFTLTILFFSIISITIVMVNIVTKSKREFAINLLLGATIKDIILRVFYQVVLLFGISITFSLLLLKKLIINSSMINFSFINITELLVCALLICISVSVLPIIRIKELSLNSILKGSE